MTEEEFDEILVQHLADKPERYLARWYENENDIWVRLVYQSFMNNSVKEIKSGLDKEWEFYQLVSESKKKRRVGGV